jgi:ectoine hydroxylase
MQATSQHLRQFVEEGYLFLPGCFSEEEVAILRDEAEQIYATNRQEVWREKTGAPRTAFAAHTYNEAFRLLGHHPRLIRPVEQVSEWIAHRDFGPIEPVPDGALLDYARAYRNRAAAE